MYFKPCCAGSDSAPKAQEQLCAGHSSSASVFRKQQCSQEIISADLSARAQQQLGDSGCVCFPNGERTELCSESRKISSTGCEAPLQKPPRNLSEPRSGPRFYTLQVEICPLTKSCKLLLTAKVLFLRRNPLPMTAASSQVHQTSR